MKLTRLTYLILALLVTVGCAQKEKQEAEETVEEPGMGFTLQKHR